MATIVKIKDFENQYKHWFSREEAMHKCTINGYVLIHEYQIVYLISYNFLSRLTMANALGQNIAFSVIFSGQKQDKPKTPYFKAEQNNKLNIH